MLTRRASGVVNFAHAAMGMYVAFAFYELRATGDLVLPVLGLPDRVHLVDAPSTALALGVAILLAAFVGLAVFVLVFRPLRHAPPLGRLVASLGVLLYLQALAALRFPPGGAGVRSLSPLLPTEPVTILGAVIPRDRIWIAGLVVASALALATVSRWTRFGRATRAAAETEKGAVLVGLSPDRLGAANWVLASILAGLAIILVAPFARLDPVQTSLLVVPALAAALLGGFRSFVVAAAGGLAIGMLQSEILKLQADHGWLPRSGLQQGVPFLVVLLVVALRGRTLPDRGTIVDRLLPRSPRPLHPVPAAFAFALVAMLGLLTLGSEWRQGIITSTIATLVCLSIVVVTGYVGQISVAPMAIAGIAGFTVAKLTAAYDVPFPLSPLLSAVIATGVGLLIGLPALRVRGMQLAIVTLAGAVALEELVFEWGWFRGDPGGTDVPEPTFLGIDLGIAAVGDAFPRVAFGVLCVVVVALCALAVANIRRSGTGLQFLAVRTNERAAAAAGIGVARTKLSAFALSSFLAGIAGTLIAYQRQTISADSFIVFLALAFVALTYLGGIGAVGGAVVAGLLAQQGVVTVALDRTGGDASEYQFAISGVALVLAAIAYPEGVSGALRSLRHRITAPRGAPRGTTPEGLA